MVGGFIRWDKLFEGSPSQEGKEVAERGAFAPVVEYDDQTHAFGLPGLITEPWQAMKRWLNGGAEENVARMRTGLPFTDEAAGDAFSIAGSAAMGGVASPKPAGSIGTFGGKSARTADLDALAAYRALAGEAESRLVEKRMNMTADERRARPPWLDYDVPEDQQIIRGAFAKGEPMMSEEPKPAGAYVTSGAGDFWKRAAKLDANADGAFGEALDAWVGGPHDTISKGITSGPMMPAALEGMDDAALVAAAEPMRALLRETFGDTVTAYRGEKSGGLQSTGRQNKLASYTMDRDVAEQFAGVRGDERPLMSPDDIAAAERTLAETGEVTIGPRTYRINPDDPRYVDMFDRNGDFITDTPSLTSAIEADNAYAAELNAERAKAMSGVREVQIPVDDVMWATDRFGQRELIARNLYANPKESAALNAAIQGERQAQKGITAYHGSPHDFDKFDISKIGTGEGAQTYGAGLYFAENEGVAKWYRDNLMPSQIKANYREAIAKSNLSSHDKEYLQALADYSIGGRMSDTLPNLVEYDLQRSIFGIRPNDPDAVRAAARDMMGAGDVPESEQIVRGAFGADGPVMSIGDDPVAAPKPAGAYVTSGAPMKSASPPARGYHGTATQGVIDQFKPGMKGDSPHMEHDTPAVFFTGSPGLADEYARSTGRELADRLAHEWRAAGKSEDEIARLYNNESHTELNAAHKMFLDRAKNALPLNVARVLGPSIERGQIDLQSIAQEFGDDVARIMSENMELAREVGNYYPDHSAVYPVDIGGNLRDVDAGAFGNNFHPVIYDNLLKESKAQGYDGLALRNVADSPFGSDQQHDVFAMFNPGHVRSATTGELLYANPKESAALNAALQSEKQGIRAYHGSPHDFDKFDLSKMGTGEGAQAYGPGLYFAENEGVARNYRNSLSGWYGDAYRLYDDLMENKPNLVPGEKWTADDQARLALSQLDRIEADAARQGRDVQYLAPIYNTVREALQTGKPPGRMYEVRINADPEDFLDWDRPLSQQNEKVKEALLKSHWSPEHMKSNVLDGAYVAPTTEHGRKLYAENGIPGIKYLDQGSRTAGEGSRNYVVFDDSLISIVKKYGIAGAASLYGMTQGEIEQALADQGQGGFIVAPEPTVE